MAERDRKKWLELFYNRLNYQPVARIRKLSEYNRQCSFFETLDIANETNADLLIRVVFPFEDAFPFKGKKCKCITVFPQILYYGRNNFYEVAKPILYDGVFYSLDEFIKISPQVYPDSARCWFAFYTFSFSFLMLLTQEVNSFSKIFLTPIKKEIKKSKYVFETRGAKKDRRLIEQRNEFIIQKAKELKGRYTTLGALCGEIGRCLWKEAKRRISDKEGDALELELKRDEMKLKEDLKPKERKESRVFCCEESTIRNVVRPIWKNLKKK